MLRLTSKKDYNKLRQSHNKIIGRFFIVVFLPEEDIKESAAGITVSKKIGNAVVRNKVKRRIRAFLRFYTLRPSTPGFISKHIMCLLNNISIYLIIFYKKNISLFLPASCRFSPTCSTYSLEAFKKYSFLKALYLSIKRILKCHPFHPGGYDPLP